MAGYIGQVLYACLWTETESPKKTNGVNIQLSLPNKLGQERIDYMEKRTIFSCEIQQVIQSGQR